MLHRILAVATVLTAMCAQACTASCPQETTEPTVPVPKNPCANFAAAGVDYNEAHGAIVKAGGVIPAGDAVGQTLTFLPGEMLGEIRVRIVPAAHESLVGMALPTIDLRKSAAPSPRIGFADDPYAARATHPDDYLAAEEYSAPHELILPLTERIVDDSGYILTIGGEVGPDAHDLVICGTQTSVSD